MNNGEQCSVCKNTRIEYFAYSNHVNKLNKTIIKHFVGELLYNLLKFSKSKLSYWLKYKLLFSPKYPIKRCNNCGYAVYTREIMDSDLKSYYNNIYWHSKGTESTDKNIYDDELDDPRSTGQYNCVKKYLIDETNIDVLEIGAGDALFSLLLRERYDGVVRINVVDPGDRWKPYYYKNDMELIADFFPFKSNKKYKYIHTSHWLEHVNNLNSTINKINSMLKKNGLVFVEVPNCNSDYFSLNTGDTPHIHFFTMASLKLIFRNEGFKCLSINEYGLTNKEEFVRRKRPDNFNVTILNQANKSISENIPRAGGSSLRGLFKKVC